MNVDKSRRNHLTAKINDASSRFSNRWCDAGDRVSANRDVASIPGTTGAVDNAAISEQKFVGLDLCSRDRREGKN